MKHSSDTERSFSYLLRRACHCRLAPPALTLVLVASGGVVASGCGGSSSPEPIPSNHVPPTSQGPSPEGDAAAVGGAPADSEKVLEWRTANLTHYTSYPDPGSEECIKYNGCKWAGYFAGVDGQKSEDWVQSHNIAAVHEKDFDRYKHKTLRLRQGQREIDVVVYDMCADSDCSGCCTANSSQTGFLIDIESFTRERFGSGSGIVEWTCLDCD